MPEPPKPPPGKRLLPVPLVLDDWIGQPRRYWIVESYEAELMPGTPILGAREPKDR